MTSCRSVYWVYGASPIFKIKSGTYCLISNEESYKDIGKKSIKLQKDGNAAALDVIPAEDIKASIKMPTELLQKKKYL